MNRGLKADVFSAEMDKEIAAIQRERISFKNRVDFTDRLTITIDPFDAKDFDDALSYKKIDGDTLEIGVHIADVTHYVKEGSVIDKEAERRGTSIYLVDNVLPMLPKALSEVVCSLRPREQKYTFSVVFLMDNSGCIKEIKFLKTVILSDYRFSYDEIQEMLDTNTTIISKKNAIQGKKYEVEKEVLEMLLVLNRIAKVHRKERTKKGGIAFNREELKFVLDKKKKPIATIFKFPTDATKLIEDFMLLANKAVAELFDKGNKKKASVYRVHDAPDLEKLKELSPFLKKNGFRLNFKKGNYLALSINTILLKIEGSPEKKIIENLLLRAMAKAKYTTKNIGHYGLSYRSYTHFTSPIRRYADVMVHRLLLQEIENRERKMVSYYEERCLHVSTMEEVAIKAERESIKQFMVKYMLGRENKVFKGVISGMIPFGIFVELNENGCEGLLKIKDVGGDYFRLDTKNYAFVGVRTKKKYTLGSAISVKVKKVNLKKLQIDFLLAE